MGTKMAKFTIRHECCGYTEEVQIYGKEADRPARAAWLAKQPCVSCRAKAAREAGIAGGSDKQLAWAGDIQSEMLSAIGRSSRMDDAKKGLVSDWVRSHSEASWYIDHRDAVTLLGIVKLIPEDDLRAMASRAGA